MSVTEGALADSLAAVIAALRDLDGAERERVISSARAFYNMAPGPRPTNYRDIPRGATSK